MPSGRVKNGSNNAFAIASGLPSLARPQAATMAHRELPARTRAVATTNALAPSSPRRTSSLP